jgi:hypothetical protein
MSWVSLTFIGAKQHKPQEVERWSKPIFDAFIAGAWLLYWTEDTIYWIAKPIVRTEIVNGRKRLHSADSAALQCDIENLYFWHGVMVPAFVVLMPERITIKHIETEQNAEVRRVLIERYGQARYLVDSGAKEIHTDDFGTLYCKEILGGEPLMMVKVVNSTPESDGTFKDYFLRVPPTMKRAREAVAWTFGKAETEYRPLLQT